MLWKPWDYRVHTVNAMLNHTDPKMRITELYIKKDFKAINVANRLCGSIEGMPCSSSLSQRCSPL